MSHMNNPMTYSNPNPMGFHNPQNQNSLYAAQLQEQFFNLTQFSQERSYHPSKVLNESLERSREKKNVREVANEESVMKFQNIL